MTDIQKSVKRTSRKSYTPPMSPRDKTEDAKQEKAGIIGAARQACRIDPAEQLERVAATEATVLIDCLERVLNPAS